MKFFDYHLPERLIVGYSALFLEQKGRSRSDNQLYYYWFYIYLEHYPILIKSNAVQDRKDDWQELTDFKERYEQLTKNIDDALQIKSYD